MCIGIPMRIVAIDGETAHCVCEGRDERVDLALVPEARAGDEILVFQGLARQLLDTRQAEQIRAALQALAAIGNGPGVGDSDAVAAGFADLIGREPSLPPHLEAARAAGLKEG
ncbi:HypC/HybG/HupF family hydrogenase formation chaperone [Beijerinckia mobilis]|uniref:HypC/HybG/HupF family hydrogenase formation chaperone n=1 Tax=Beijerinckia mobilis TaxID=231434 RepID=UPI00054CF837|nr:HypC/HybG/HupF family hydrogenase formation chaperone [Beijerinckia mobilis]